ncbi:hypothetical protein VHEMI01246 [[Torrubiella] hemipterigena]|uniref:Uncharacterized protein n=1 Tax=[Torrubiella] hemipterigena TaxID=1531966 RepID=A0A0A1T4U2_9HYPO|nr:hypothetical protein VHEMI01246 [[Torrubiella] hemipterigena]
MESSQSISGMEFAPDDQGAYLDDLIAELRTASDNGTAVVTAVENIPIPTTEIITFSEAPNYDIPPTPIPVYDPPTLDVDSSYIDMFTREEQTPGHSRASSPIQDREDQGGEYQDDKDQDKNGEEAPKRWLAIAVVKKMDITFSNNIRLLDLVSLNGIKIENEAAFRKAQYFELQSARRWNVPFRNKPLSRSAKSYQLPDEITLIDPMDNSKDEVDVVVFQSAARLNKLKGLFKKQRPPTKKAAPTQRSKKTRSGSKPTGNILYFLKFPGHVIKEILWHILVVQTPIQVRED